MSAYHIEKVSNGYIVTESHPLRNGAMIPRDYAVAAPPPHVFESFDAMAKWLNESFNGAPVVPGAAQARPY